MGNTNKLLVAEVAATESWTATAQLWGDGSEDLALPIPLNIQRKLGLNENSVVTAAFIDGQLVISEVSTKESLHDNDNDNDNDN